ncbi:aminopeptidase [Fulvivirga sp. M361]|uniref:M20/M25/M40 family metallo-hydrolase n=1 Tax=Fulvivirga sp. M361 TaxID=2594266 RepID=UPI001179AE7D|nr:M20/M25/M40 family metallo-hydrolase [Fulvivirga sp. M361]TRX61282.1 aminopeptidase [Fulvivirga sp. M361]
METRLLKQLCESFGPSGNEVMVKDYILDYIKRESNAWVTVPEVYHGDEFQDNIILKFGTPKTAIFAHMDSIGFTVRYQNQLVAIGGPDTKSGYLLTGSDAMGPIECELDVSKDHQLFYKFGRPIATGTNLVYKCDFRETSDTISSCCLDNRLGVYNALRVAETLENGVIVFSTWEEHGGGSVPHLIRFLYERWSLRQVLISDITWVTDGVHPGQGVAISMRDRNIPRKSFIDKIIAHAEASGVDYQLEVEGNGSSDGREIQLSPYPIDWCFIGAAEENVHTPNETVNKHDIKCMITLYQYLMKHL